MSARLLGSLRFLPVVVAWVWLAAPVHAQQVGGEGVDAVVDPDLRGGFVHAVYFWLSEDLSADEQAAFVQGLESLRGIETVQHGWIGVPAATDRPIIDRSYSYALILVFADGAGQDAYQDHPVHDRFRDQFADFWTRVQIYDSVTPPDQP